MCIKIWKECPTCNKEDDVMNDDFFVITECPSCEMLIKDDVTLEDHGVCFDCHHDILNGERCRICFQVDHDWEACPEIEGKQLERIE